MTAKRKPTVFRENEGIWVHWFGHPLRYLATTEETEGKYCLSVGSVDFGHGASPHSHSFDEGFYVLAGEVEFTAGNRTVLLREGEYINIKAGTVHYPRGASREPAKMLVIAAPCGFDQFQLAVGERLSDSKSVPSKSEADMHAAVDRLAPQYGVNMHPTADAINSSPNIHVTRSKDGEVIDVVGDRYRFLSQGIHTDNAYAIWHATITPGGGPPPHIHRREEEGFFVLKGELTFEADGQSFVGTAGTFVNLPIDSRHRFHNHTSQPTEVLILVAPAGIENMFRYTGTAIHDLNTPVTKPSMEEKHRLMEAAGQYGIEIG